MIHRSLTAAVRRHGRCLAVVPRPQPDFGLRSWAAQTPTGLETGALAPLPRGPGRFALLCFAGGSMAVGFGISRALDRPKHLGANLQSRDTDTALGAVVEAGIMRMGFDDAAKRLLDSRAPHTRGPGAKLLLEHAPVEATVRELQRHSELEADTVVEHQKSWSLPYLAPGGIEAALIENLPRVLTENPGLQSRLLAATDTDARRLRPLMPALRDASGRAELTALLASPDAIIRRRAVFSLQQTTDGAASEAPPAWLALAADPDRMTRRQVCAGLSAMSLRHEAPAWLKPTCEQLAADPDPLVARFANSVREGPRSLRAR